MEIGEEETLKDNQGIITNNHGGETQTATTMEIRMDIQTKMDPKMETETLEINSTTRIGSTKIATMEEHQTQPNHANLLLQKWSMLILTLA